MLEKFKEVFSDIEINEDQAKALNSFFEEYSRSLEKKFKSKYEEAFDPNKNGYIKASEAEKAFELFKKESEMAFEAYKADSEKAFVLFERDAEMAFELFESDSEKAFELFESDAEMAFEAFENDSKSAFTLFEEDSKNAFGLFMEDSSKAFDMFNQDVITEHSEKMAQIIEDLYPTLEEKVRQDLLSSDEFKIYESFKHQIKPYLINESETEHSLRKQVDFLKAELESLNEEKEVSERDQTIEDLISDLPAKEMKIIKNYIEKAKNTDEIFERYNLAMELLNSKGTLETYAEETDEEEYDETDEEDFEDYNESDEEDFEDYEELKRYKKDDNVYEEDEDLEDEDYLYQEDMDSESDEENVIFESNTVESKKENKKFNTVEDAIIESVFGKK
jgi:hypothetical protein